MIFIVKFICGLVTMFFSMCAGYSLQEDDKKVFYGFAVMAGIFFAFTIW